MMKRSSSLFNPEGSNTATHSKIMNSSRPTEERVKLLCDVPAATAILDSFPRRAEIVAISGKSYRLKDLAKTKA
jgi:hypothetical protein